MRGLLVTRRCATRYRGRGGGAARVFRARGREDSVPGEGGARGLDDRRVGHIHGKRFAEHAEAREAEHRKRAKCGWPEDQRPHLCNLASVGFRGSPKPALHVSHIMRTQARGTCVCAIDI
jgi:hypothetical protein